MSERRGMGSPRLNAEGKPRLAAANYFKPAKKFFSEAIVEDDEDSSSNASLVFPDITSSSDSDDAYHGIADLKTDEEEDSDGSVNFYDVQNMCVGNKNDKPKNYRSEIAYPNSFVYDDYKRNQATRQADKPPIAVEETKEDEVVNHFRMVEIEIVDRDPYEPLEDEEKPKLQKKPKVHRCRFAPKFRHLCPKNKYSIYSASFANGYYPTSSEGSDCTSDEESKSRHSAANKRAEL